MGAPVDGEERGVILVVEDDDDFRELLVDHLVGAGHRVRWARHGREALEVLARAAGSIRLLLLDLRMPVMDGHEVCRALAAAPELHRIPILVMTAEHETRDVGSSRSVVAVLHKPLDLGRLEALLAAHAGA